jgi:excalibur calcium-binding domain-containing protein
LSASSRSSAGRYANRLEFLAKRARTTKLGLWKACPHTPYNPYHGVQRDAERKRANDECSGRRSAANGSAGVGSEHIVGWRGQRADPAALEELHRREQAISHGVGRVGARDRTAGEPVTNFTHNNYLYRLAMRYNRGLDRDKDGIACEKL